MKDPDLRHVTRWLLGFVGLLLFAVGVLVGQQAQRSKFDKYLQSTNVTAMQLALISANLDIIRQSTSSEIGVGVPEVYYDAKTGSLSAAAIVTDELTKKPVAQVRGTILGLSDLWLNDIQRYMPDVPKRT